MKTNDIFNFRRFGRYFVSDLRSCSANFGLSALLISLAGLILYAVVVITNIIFEQVWEGPSLGARIPLFCAAIAVFVMTMPAKSYGHVTDKRAGSSWLMVPASRLEKVLSMVVLTVLIMPLLSAAAYLAVDAVICAIDGTCGQSIASVALNARETISGLMSNEIKIDGVTIVGEGNTAFEFIRQITNPWLYIDDVIGIILIFLLGALVFKSSKPGKTLLTIIGGSMALSMVASPLLAPWTKELVGIVESNDPEQIFGLWIFRHVALFDTINDTVVNIALLLGIWFRIKTLKH